MTAWRNAIARCLCLAWLAAAPAAAPAADDSAGRGGGMENPGHIEHPEWFKVSFLDIAEDIAEARDAGKHYVLYFYQDGCPYCKKLIEDNFGQFEITDYTQRHFDLVALDMYGSREVTGMDGAVISEKEFIKRHRVQATPSFIFFDMKGNIAFRMNGYQPPGKFFDVLRYVAEKKYYEMKYIDYLRQRPARKASGVLHSLDGAARPPFDVRKLIDDSGKPLLVLFEQKQCLSCDELHGDILRREESAELLRLFRTAQVDIRGGGEVVTPAGATLEATEWAESLNISYVPTLLFFDTAANEAFRLEGYVKSFHIQSAMEYVAHGTHAKQPDFQAFLRERTARLKAQGIEVDILN